MVLYLPGSMQRRLKFAMMVWRTAARLAMLSLLLLLLLLLPLLARLFCGKTLFDEYLGECPGLSSIWASGCGCDGRSSLTIVCFCCCCFCSRGPRLRVFLGGLNALNHRSLALAAGGLGRDFIEPVADGGGAVIDFVVAVTNVVVAAVVCRVCCRIPGGRPFWRLDSGSSCVGCFVAVAGSVGGEFAGQPPNSGTGASSLVAVDKRF
ncbi:hypothetical protein B0T26DRAFT_480949 [Lasiosphaeria miniovina]|uniref:Uncharacterized protein n=1 Tax=Lasiosphaeria miniovina TaxID=1954250 RepID=A0AA40A0D5_9PEZI|nr:uncharacterized protein B0T26DRAFT_480949 [Lasiosphaeria miniovina]KAK0706948.1 hypothetical protein B0T26DRAFT_480949 [Lasiosphaeria miniovina]